MVSRGVVQGMICPWVYLELSRRYRGVTSAVHFLDASCVVSEASWQIHPVIVLNLSALLTEEVRLIRLMTMTRFLHEFASRNNISLLEFQGAVFAGNLHTT